MANEQLYSQFSKLLQNDDVKFKGTFLSIEPGPEKIQQALETLLNKQHQALIKDVRNLRKALKKLSIDDLLRYRNGRLKNTDHNLTLTNEEICRYIDGEIEEKRTRSAHRPWAQLLLPFVTGGIVSVVTWEWILWW